jgi:hypothetical protein
LTACKKKACRSNIISEFKQNDWKHFAFSCFILNNYFENQKSLFCQDTLDRVKYFMKTIILEVEPRLYFNIQIITLTGQTTIYRVATNWTIKTLKERIQMIGYNGGELKMSLVCAGRNLSDEDEKLEKFYVKQDESGKQNINNASFRILVRKSEFSKARMLEC